MSQLFFFSSRRRHTRCSRDWSSDVCSSNPALYATIGGTIAVMIVLLALVGGQIAQMQREAQEREARARVDALFNEAYQDSGGEPAPVDEGDKPVADDYYYPEGE